MPVVITIPRPSWQKRFVRAASFLPKPTRDLSEVHLRCPSCGAWGSLGYDHCVTRSGAVHPEILCPNETCHFDGLVRLESWDPEITGADAASAPRFYVGDL